MSLYFYIKESMRDVKNCMKVKNMEFNKKISDINYSPKNPFMPLNKDLSWTLQLNVNMIKSAYL